MLLAMFQQRGLSKTVEARTKVFALTLRHHLQPEGRGDLLCQVVALGRALPHLQRRRICIGNLLQ
jgi:hypothetical protein